MNTCKELNIELCPTCNTKEYSRVNNFICYVNWFNDYICGKFSGTGGVGDNLIEALSFYKRNTFYIRKAVELYHPELLNKLNTYMLLK